VREEREGVGVEKKRRSFGGTLETSKGQKVAGRVLFALWVYLLHIDRFV